MEEGWGSVSVAVNPVIEPLLKAMLLGITLASREDYFGHGYGVI